MRFQIIVFALVRIVFNTMHRMVYPFLSTFAAGLGVGLPAISLALTVRALSGFAGPLVAPIADTRGRKIGLLFDWVFIRSVLG